VNCRPMWFCDIPAPARPPRLIFRSARVHAGVPDDAAPELVPPAEALAREGAGVRGGVGGQDGDPLGIGVAAALLPAALDWPGLARGRGKPGPGHGDRGQVRGDPLLQFPELGVQEAGGAQQRRGGMRRAADRTACRTAPPELLAGN
jgi:hypothetical protein